MQSQDMGATIEKTAHWIAERRASEEGQEGMTAFLEKRKANCVNYVRKIT